MAENVSISRMVYTLLSDILEAVCTKLAPVIGVQSKDVKMGLGVALGLIALHRLLSLKDKQQGGAARVAAAEEETSVVGVQRGTFAQTAAGSLVLPTVAERLKGVTRLTMATSGILFDNLHKSSPHSPANLSVIPSAAEALRQAAAIADVYLITLVDSDAAEAAVLSALTAAGVVGTAAGLVPPHKVLFCGTPVGRVALVRQIDPQLHIESNAETARELGRFGTRLLHVAQPGDSLPAVPTAPSIAAFLGLPSQESGENTSTAAAAGDT